MFKAHWNRDGKAACGAKDHNAKGLRVYLTRDPRRVDCLRCRRVSDGKVSNA